MGIYNFIFTTINSLLPPTRFFYLRHLLLRIMGHSVHSGAKICGRVKIFGDGKIIIGESSWIGIGVEFYTAQNADLSIGCNCDVAPNVIFHTGTHEIGPRTRRAGEPVSIGISVGDGVWIGTRATVLAGVSISGGVIIGAGTVVNKSITTPNVLITGASLTCRSILQ